MLFSLSLFIIHPSLLISFINQHYVRILYLFLFCCECLYEHILFNITVPCSKLCHHSCTTRSYFISVIVYKSILYHGILVTTIIINANLEARQVDVTTCRQKSWHVNHLIWRQKYRFLVNDTDCYTHNFHVNKLLYTVQNG